MPSSIATPSVGRAGLPPQQRGQAGESGNADQPCARLGAVEIAPQHAQRRHAPQRQHRRRAEREQHDHADAIALQRRQPAGRRNRQLPALRSSQLPIAHCSPNAIATPTRARDQAEQHHLADMDADQRALAGAEAAHHRGAGEMPLAVAARGHRHRDRGEHDRDQRGEAEETAGAIERGADFRARVADGFQALPARRAPGARCR